MRAKVLGDSDDGMGKNKSQRQQTLSRRRFLLSASTLLLASTSRASEFTLPSLLNQSRQRTYGLDLVPEDTSGFFSIWRDDRPLIQHAHMLIETEHASFRSTDAGIQARIDRQDHQQRLWFIHKRKQIDFGVRWTSLPNEPVLFIDAIILNKSKLPIRLKNVFPILAVNDYGGALQVWDDIKHVCVLSNEWERCYGRAGVYSLEAESVVESAWDIHLFNVNTGTNLSAGFYEIPTTKLSYSIRPHPSLSRADFVIRADAHAGKRGVLLEPAQEFSTGELFFRVSSDSPTKHLEQTAEMVAKRNGQRQSKQCRSVGWTGISPKRQRQNKMSSTISISWRVS